jgi:hypothetical protein
MWKVIVAAVLLVLGALVWMLRSPRPVLHPAAPAAVVRATPVPSPPGSWLEKIRSAPVADFPQILKSLLALPDASAREAALAALFTRWVNADLPGLRAALKAFPPGDPAWLHLLPALVKALPRASDPTAANPQFQQLVAQIAAAYAATDPDAALAWARQWLVGDGLDSALLAIVGSLAQKSPDRATALLAAIQDPLVRASAVDEIAAVLAPASPDAAFAWAQALPEELRTEGAKASLDILAEKDARAAQREFLRFRALIVTAEPPANSSTPVVETLSDTAAAIAERLAAIDGADAMNWAASLPPALRADAAQGALAGWAAAKPQDAAAYVTSRRDADGAEVVFEKWSAAEPEAAALQAQSLADPDLRERAVTGLLTGWQDAAGTAEIGDWAATLPEGPGRDAVNVVLARDLADAEPQKAWQRAAAIEDAAARAAARREIVKTTAEADPAAAKTLIDADKSLSTAEVAALREAASAPEVPAR